MRTIALFLSVSLAVSLAGWVGASHAQTYPGQPIQMVIYNGRA